MTEVKKPEETTSFLKRAKDFLPTILVANGIFGFSLRESIQCALGKEPEGLTKPSQLPQAEQKIEPRATQPASGIKINRPSNPGKFMLKLAERGRFAPITKERLEELGINENSTVEDFDEMLARTPFVGEELEGVRKIEEFTLPQLKQGMSEKEVNKTIEEAGNYRSGWVERANDALFRPVVGFVMAKKFGLSTRESLKVAFGKNEKAN